jgi:hypothetical protein
MTALGNIVDSGSEETLLRAIRDRLIDKVPSSVLTLRNCLITDAQVPLIFPVDPFVTVSPGDAQFDQAAWIGGGVNQLTQRGYISVAPFVRCQLDQPPSMEHAMLHDTRGLLLVWKPAILKALLVSDDSWDCTCGNQHAWEPTLGGYPILRDQLRPVSCSSPRYVPPEKEGGIPFLSFVLTLEAVFDWELR